jgi:hypothetical protein
VIVVLAFWLVLAGGEWALQRAGSGILARFAPVPLGPALRFPRRTSSPLLPIDAAGLRVKSDHAVLWMDCSILGGRDPVLARLKMRYEHGAVVVSTRYVVAPFFSWLLLPVGIAMSATPWALVLFWPFSVIAVLRMILVRDELEQRVRWVACAIAR